MAGGRNMLLECKQCGGQVPYGEEGNVAICPYCGAQNTVGKSAAEMGGLVNRANYLRRNNEFDKAAAVYEDLLRLDNTDYEAHWGLILCKYGIEYVEDPASGEKKPTCHRASPDSILGESDYRAALEYAPGDVRMVYEREAVQIDAILKNIIALSNCEQKYDVFLCYKELDEAGERTPDSVIAQELEFELTRRGYQVFFARKTLEHALGSEYEPIIYAALQSARAMVVLGTKPAHFNAVWVRNEWGRYRELIRKGAKKILIPAYRGMSPYDLPIELSNLQALDMSKLGFVQDLCDGIDRMTRSVKTMERADDASPIPQNGGVEALLKRSFLFLEEGNFSKAEEYLERVLDISPEEPRAYLGKLMVESNAKKEEDLANTERRINLSSNFINAKKFGTGSLVERLEQYAGAALERVQTMEQSRLQSERRREAEQEQETQKQRKIQSSIEALQRRIPSGNAAFGFGLTLVFLLYILVMVMISKGSRDSSQGAFVILIFGLLPGFLLVNTGSIRRQERKFLEKYHKSLAPGVAISELARVANAPPRKVQKSLEKWIQKGYFEYAVLSDGKLLFEIPESGETGGANH